MVEMIAPQALVVITTHLLSLPSANAVAYSVAAKAPQLTVVLSWTTYDHT